MAPATQQLIATLHSLPARWAFVLTGGGASVAGELLSVPGGSRTILEIAVPYHEQALTEFLGSPPDNHCSAATSQMMARRALQRARWLAPGEAFGLACTASLVSDRPKRGDHRVHVSTAGRGSLRTWSLTLNKGARDRAGEESVAAALILHAMAQTLGMAELAAIPLLANEEIEASTECIAPWSSALDSAGAVLVAVDGQISPDARWDSRRPVALVSGAFNPLHSAHLALAAAAERLEGTPVAFELSTANVDKPELTSEDVRRRLGQFVGKAPIWLTRAARFVDKARLFPGAIWVLGADTAARLVAPRYYGDDEEHLRRAFDIFREQGCRFLVAGRLDATGQYLGLDDLAIPREYRDLFRAMTPMDFRMDVSSTLLRSRSSR
jgi:hypothetical protein